MADLSQEVLLVFLEDGLRVYIQVHLPIAAEQIFPRKKCKLNQIDEGLMGIGSPRRWVFAFLNCKDRLLVEVGEKGQEEMEWEVVKRV